MMITDADYVETNRRVRNRRDRIEGPVPPEYERFLQGLRFCQMCPVAVYAEQHVIAAAVACVAREREVPSLHYQMLADDAIHLALRVLRTGGDAR